jgi:carboxyl-terminal processing protease
MKMKYKYILLAVVFATGMSAITVNNDRLFEISKNIEIFVKVYKELNANYVDDIDPSQLMRTGIDAMVGSLDPYTNYISESQVQGYRIESEGKYQGIGAIVEKVGDHLTVIAPYQGSPAIEAGLKAGDKILKVDGLSTDGRSQSDLNEMVRGVPGTMLNLTIERPGTVGAFDIDLRRGEVNINNVPYSGMVSDDIGYISLTTFTQKAGANVAGALKNLKKENPGIAGVILDLRYNGGGLLAEALNVSNVFVPKDLELVSVRGKVRERDAAYKTRNIPVDLEIPVAVLINKRSASASEIVSGAIQDLDRGVLIGQRSFGKGLVQNTKDVGYNSRVKLTTSKYYIPSGRCIQSVEYEDGEPKDIPEELRAKFKTKRGRTVTDGGGVAPDVKLEAPVLSDATESLLKDKVIFNYVTDYLLENKIDSIALEDISFDDYASFEQFVKKQNYTFQTKAEKELEEMESEISETEKKIILNDLSSMKKKIDQEKSDDIQEYKTEITKEIEKEIATRFHFQKGSTYVKLRGDTEVQEAISILGDPAKYNKILGK